MSTTTRRFKVDAFIGEDSEVVEVELEDHNLTHGDIKKAVGKALGLKAESTNVFGLFKLFPSILYHPPPRELCIDTDSVSPKGDGGQDQDREYDFGFLRLSFNKDEEVKILGEDRFAIALIFWEVTCMKDQGEYTGRHEEISRLMINMGDYLMEDVSNGEGLLSMLESRRVKIIPVQEREIFKQLDWLQKIILSSIYDVKQETDQTVILGSGNDDTVSLMTLYMEIMHRLTFYYWSYYYKVVGCTLCGENAALLAAYLDLDKECIIDVVLNQKCLSFIGKKSSGIYLQLIDFPWCNIRYVTRNTSMDMFSFQILVKDRSEHISYETISICTEKCLYLYSLAVHILGIQAEVLGNDKNVLPPTEHAIESIIPANNKELKFRIMNFLSHTSIPQHDEQNFPQPNDTQESIFLNKGYVATIIDMKKILLYNTQTNIGSREIVHGGNVLVSQYKQADIPSPYEISLKSPSITVHAFWKGPYKIHSLFCSTIGEFKMYVGKFLCLEPNSLEIFGLFLCSHESPLDITTELCLDTDSLLPDISELSFRRLSFNKSLEKSVCKSDIQALNFLWSEAKYMFDKDKVLLRPKEETMETLISASTHESFKVIFMECFAIAYGSYWWNVYYRADGSDLSEENSDEVQSVAMNVKFLFLLKDFMESFTMISLDCVRCVMIPKTKQKPKKLIFETVVNKETQNEQGYEKVLDCVTLNTVKYEYFYSIAKHIFGLRLMVMGKNKDKLINSNFKGPGHVGLFPDQALQVVNMTFTGLSKRPIHN